MNDSVFLKTNTFVTFASWQQKSHQITFLYIFNIYSDCFKTVRIGELLLLSSGLSDNSDYLEHIKIG